MSADDCHPMLLTTTLLLFPWFILLAIGDVKITYPPDDSFESFDLSSGFATLNVKWFVTEDWPNENDIEYYTFALVAGSNRGLGAMADLGTLQAEELSGNDAQFLVSNTIGTTGMYMFQVLAMSHTGYTIHYSQRFKLAGMTGTKIAPESTDKRPPDPEFKNFQDAVPIEIDSRSFTVPYHLQTGRVKFAPMQMQPPTKMTKTRWTRIHETSALTYYSKINGNIQQLTTVTPGWSYVLPIGHNYATPAPMPRDNGGWHAPTKRLSLKPRKTTTR